MPRLPYRRVSAVPCCLSSHCWSRFVSLVLYLVCTHPPLSCVFWCGSFIMYSSNWNLRAANFSRLSKGHSWCKLNRNYTWTWSVGATLTASQILWIEARSLAAKDTVRRDVCTSAVDALIRSHRAEALLSSTIVPLQAPPDSPSLDARLQGASGKPHRVHCTMDLGGRAGGLSIRRPALQNLPAADKDYYGVRLPALWPAIITILCSFVLGPNNHISRQT